MNLTTYQKIGILLLVAAVVVLIIFLPKRGQTPTDTNQNGQNQNSNQQASDFASCVTAGFPVQESFPRQCSANGQTFTETVSDQTEVVMINPSNGEIVSSPLLVSGRARRNWFFEANIPVTLKDDKGNVLAKKGMQATEDWMTEDFVDFSGELTFKQPTSEFGVLIINNDNPSGDPDREKEFAVPVRFR